METSSGPSHPDRHEERTALALADQARERLTTGLRLPGGFYSVLGSAVGVQLGTAAYGIAAQTAPGLAVVLAGLAVFLGSAAILLNRFHRVNGVRVDGLTSHVVFATSTFTSLVYLGALAAGVWAAFASLWWLVAATAALGGMGFALGARRWWHAYQHDPTTHSSGLSPRQLGGTAVLAAIGVAALVVLG